MSYIHAVFQFFALACVYKRPGYFSVTALSLLALGFSSVLQAETLSFSSGKQRNTLLELYTSEGCSSCPPADRWLGQLKKDPRLWDTLFPIALHVDYWNYLGWQDRFSQADYSNRQRQYALNRYAKTVYTPGFFSNGREWRGWFKRDPIPFANQAQVGELAFTVTPESIAAVFVPVMSHSSPLILHLAVLGFDIQIQVDAGENGGKLLQHDFVVLSLTQYSATPQDEVFHWQINKRVRQITLPKGVTQQNIKAVTGWVSKTDDPTPIQTAGTWLR